MPIFRALVKALNEHLPSIKIEIPRTSFRQISETFTVSFMSYRPANVPVCFGKKAAFYDIFRKNTTIVLLKIENYAFQHSSNIDQWK